MNIFYIAFALITLGVLVFAFYQIQYFLFFTPTYKRRENLGDEFNFLSITADDGVELEGIVYEPSEPRSTLLFFVGRDHDAVGIMPKLASSYKDSRIVAFNYRSYGKSGGKVSEKNLFLDALLITKKVKKYYGKMYLGGFSLGSSIALYVASKVDVKASFIMSPFDTLANLTKETHGIIFARFLRYKYDNTSFVEHIESDTYIFASKADEVIYIKNTRSLIPHVKNLSSYSEYEDLSHAELLWHPKMLRDINGVMNG